MRVFLAAALLAAAAGAEEIVVRVTLDAEPVDGAGVAVLAADAPLVFDPAEWKPAARTDAGGTAELDVPRDGSVLVYLAGYRLVEVFADGPTVDVALAPEYVFSGRVADGDDAPVAGAAVTLKTTHNREAAFPARTDAEGRFHVYGLWFDDYALRIEAPGFVPEERMELTEKDSGTTFVLTKVATVAGRVMDASGKLQPGVPVLVGPRRVTTDEDGSFVALGVTPGIVAVRLAPPRGGGKDVAVAEGAVARVDVLALAPAGLRFRTVNAQGEPWAGVKVSGAFEATTGADGVAQVEVAPRETAVVALETDANGFSHEFAPIEPGVVFDAGDVVLEPPVAVEVRVFLPDGTPAPEGRVGHEPLRDGVARVTETQPVYVPGYPVVTAEVAPPGPVDVTLPEPRWIHGVVFGPDGAPVEGATVESGFEEAKTDAEGRFRIGPFNDRPHDVRARTATAASRNYTVTGFDGELEIHLAPRPLEFVAGRVLRGGEPVTRFYARGEWIVDAEGRFDLLVKRPDPLMIEVASRRYYFPLPPPGEELVALLPDGAANVTPVGAVPGVEVELRDATGARVDTAKTGPDGIARFAGLPEAAYTASAPGFQPVAFTVRPGDPPTVALPAVAAGALRVRLPAGFTPAERVLPAGAHRIRGPFAVEIAAADVAPGAELLLDLVPADAGSLLVRGGESFALERSEPGLAYTLEAEPGASGEFRFATLPPGAYRLVYGIRERIVDVEPGRMTVVELEGATRTIRGRVQLLGGKPAQGAQVWVVGGTRERTAGLTDLKGGFVVRDLPPGDYLLRAELPGHAAAVAVAVDGVLLTLEPSAAGRAQLLGTLGEPLRGVPVRVDGTWRRTDDLGFFPLDREPARVSLDLDGFASLRDEKVRSGAEVRLERGASLRVVHDLDPERVAVRIDGLAWAPLERRLRPAADGLALSGLPAAPVEVEVRPAEEGGEPEIVRATLVAGTETTIDLRSE